MTFAKAREQWEKENPDGNWDSLTRDEQKAILTDAVIAERKRRK